MKYLMLLLLLSLFACSDPMDTVYNEDDLPDQIKIVKAEIGDEQGEVVFSYILKSVMSGTSLEGKTYAELLKEAEAARVKKLDEVKALEEKKKELAEKEAARQKLFGETASVVMTDKYYDKVGYKEFISFPLEITNTSDKEIRALKGAFHLYDVFDEKLMIVNIQYDEPIKPGETAKYEPSLDYNQYKARDVKVRDVDFKDMKAEWSCKAILFKDGTKID